MPSPRSFLAALAASAVTLSLGLASPASATGVDSVEQARAVSPQAATRTTAQASDLSYAPKNFVGGQALTLSGRLPGNGVRPISVQQHMNRPGDSWFEVRDASGRTAADGSFSVQVPAPSMFGISYRVVGGGAATSGVLLSARSQDLTLQPTRTQYGFDILVDTTPDIVAKPESKGLPVFEGRGLRLQRRDPGTFAWSDVGRSAVRGDGSGRFSVTEPGWYRVVQEAITSGGNRIGWYPSFPTPVGVAASAPAARVAPAAASGGRIGTFGLSGATMTAASKYKWGRAAFDFAWERAEALDAGPAQGDLSRGRWQDVSTGTGRVAQLNGGLALESGRDRRGGIHHGDTSATLQGASMAYGRWEARLRESIPGGQRSYTYRVQLVPDGLAAGACSPDSITMAQFEARSGVMSFGVRNGGRQWGRSLRVGSIQHSVPAVAVEVTPRHITWFVDGRVVGTIKNRQAIPSGAKTLRISLVGNGPQHLTSSTIISDWQRAYEMRGKGTASGPRLGARPSADSSC